MNRIPLYFMCYQSFVPQVILLKIRHLYTFSPTTTLWNSLPSWPDPFCKRDVLSQQDFNLVKWSFSNNNNILLLRRKNNVLSLSQVSLKLKIYDESNWLLSRPKHLGPKKQEISRICITYLVPNFLQGNCLATKHFLMMQKMFGGICQTQFLLLTNELKIPADTRILRPTLFMHHSFCYVLSCKKWSYQFFLSSSSSLSSVLYCWPASSQWSGREL